MASSAEPDIDKLKANRDVKGLIKALGYKKHSGQYRDHEIRWHAARALGALGDPRAARPLIKLLKDDDVNYFAIDALEELGDTRAFKPVLAILKDAHWRPSIRIEAARMLGRLYKEGKLTDKQKKLLLSQKGLVIREHADKKGHADKPGQRGHADVTCFTGKHDDFPPYPHMDKPDHTDKSTSTSLDFPL
jgi:HEAT repeat protein